MDIDLSGRTALVTGAGRGNGRAIARMLAEHGAQTVVNDIQRDVAEATAADIRDEGGDAYGIAADVSNAAAVEEMIEEVTDVFDSVDILVNNAGIGGAHGLTELDDTSSFDDFLDVHLRGAINCTHAVLDPMVDQGYGKIVNLTSIHTKSGVGGSAEYDVAKFGLLGLTKTLALELGRSGIRVNAVAPGWVDTRMTAGLDEETVERITNLNPLQRFADPEEIADAVTFLASPASDYINGHELRVDGGQQPIDRWP